MISQAKIKLIKSLQNKKFRDQYGLFTVEGEKMVSEVLKSSFEVEEVFTRDEIGEETMARISALSNPSPVLALVRKPAPEAVQVPSEGLFLALDTIRDPGNMGTIIRIADWFGLDGIFASEGSVDVFNPKVVQSTMGAIFRVKFNYCDIPSLCRDMVSKGGKVYGTFLDGDNIYRQSLSDSLSLIVIGNESEGISEEVSRLVTDRLFIPPYPEDEPGSESLNAAVATAVTVAEFRRRKSICF